MILCLSGDSIECGKCEVIARKIVPSSPQIDKVLGRIIKYDCSRNSSAENFKELSPKKFKYKFSSNLDLNSKLQADSLFFLTTQLKRLRLNVVHESGKHKANKGVINDYTFAEIKYPLENVLNSIKKSKELK